MRKGAVYFRGDYAGEIVELAPNAYLFRYDDAYFAASDKPAISLNLSKNQQEYHQACCILTRATILVFCWQRLERMLLER